MKLSTKTFNAVIVLFGAVAAGALLGCGSMSGLLGNVGLNLGSSSGSGSTKTKTARAERKYRQTDRGHASADPPRRPPRRRQLATNEDLSDDSETRSVTDASGTSSHSRTNHSSNSVSVRINGVVQEDRESAPRSRADRRPASGKKPFKATCRKNSECESETCWVAGGRLGYCTKMCDRFTDCPTFWKCRQAATNAPQKICVQKGSR